MKFKIIDWIAFAVILWLLLVPGVDDFFDAGLPLIESLLAFGYFVSRKYGGKLFG